MSRSRSSRALRRVLSPSARASQPKNDVCAGASPAINPCRSRTDSPAAPAGHTSGFAGTAPARRQRSSRPALRITAGHTSGVFSADENRARDTVCPRVDQSRTERVGPVECARVQHHVVWPDAIPALIRPRASRAPRDARARHPSAAPWCPKCRGDTPDLPRAYRHTFRAAQ